MDKKSFLAGSSLVLVLLFSLASAIATSGGSSELGIDVYEGELRMHGNNVSNADLVDGVNLSNPGSNIEVSGDQYAIVQGQDSGLDADTLDGSQPSALSWTDLGIAQSDVAASDIGLGNVRNVDLADTAGSNLSYNTSSEEYVVNASSIQSGTTKSDVGLGNLINKEQLAVDGSNAMNANLEMSGRAIKSVNTLEDGGNNIWVSGEGIDADQDMHLTSDGSIELRADQEGSYGGGPFSCNLEKSSGDWNCDGAKNWVHDLNSTHEAVYSSQESPQVRAVYEGQVNVDNGKLNVSLPYHFSETVSDERPSLRVQATPHSLATVAVTERTDEWLVIEADSADTVEVDYRVTGIREGYEDKDVVREKK